MRINDIILEAVKPDQRVLDFIDQVYAEYPVSPFNPNQHAVLTGEGEDQTIALFELEPSKSVPGAVEIHWIQAYPQRQGVGTKAIRELQAKARSAGLKMSLYPKPNGKVSQASLKRLYKRLGFNPVHKGAATMVWDPDNDPLIDEVEEYTHFDLHHELFEEIAKLDPMLFENSSDYLRIKKTLGEFATAKPIVGERYIYASVSATPIAKMINFAKFDTLHEFVGMHDGRYVFDINGRKKVLPEQGGIDKGDSYQHIFVFASKQKYEKMVFWLLTGTDDYEVTYRTLD